MPKYQKILALRDFACNVLGIWKQFTKMVEIGFVA